MDDRLVAVFSCDEQYCKIMSVAMISLFEKNKEFGNVVVYCLLHNVDHNMIKNLYGIARKYKREIVCIDIRAYCNKYRFWEKKEDSRYVRLILSKIITEEKVLYLDCDILIVRSLRELWTLDLSRYAQAAVLDTVRQEARLESNVLSNENYFNSGVLLINLKYWRENNVIDDYINFSLNNRNKGIYRDQRIINGTLKDKTMLLQPIYNYTPELQMFNSQQIRELTKSVYFYSNKEIIEARNVPVIIHFAGRSIDRPWYGNCAHNYKAEYRELMKQTSFTDFPLWKDSKSNVFKWWLRKHLPFCLFLFMSKISNIKNQSIIRDSRGSTG